MVSGEEGHRKQGSISSTPMRKGSLLVGGMMLLPIVEHMKMSTC